MLIDMRQQQQLCFVLWCYCLLLSAGAPLGGGGLYISISISSGL